MGNNEQVRTRLASAHKLIEECISLLGDARATAPAPAPKARIAKASAVDFSMSLRAFANKHAKGLSGPQKFVLLLARLASGDKSQSIPLGTISAEWDKMTSILGGRFNRFYSNQARERDWVATTKAGSYHLRPNWLEAIE